MPKTQLRRTAVRRQWREEQHQTRRAIVRRLEACSLVLSTAVLVISTLDLGLSSLWILPFAALFTLIYHLMRLYRLCFSTFDVLKRSRKSCILALPWIPGCAVVAYTLIFGSVRSPFGNRRLRATLATNVALVVLGLLESGVLGAFSMLGRGEENYSTPGTSFGPMSEYSGSVVIPRAPDPAQVRVDHSTGCVIFLYL